MSVAVRGDSYGKRIHQDYNTSYEKTLIHEHDFVSVVTEERKRIIRCITCGTCFCEICGKVLNAALLHADQLCFEVDK
jgi:hypothetical protein